jgi:hypothetical protein
VTCSITNELVGDSLKMIEGFLNAGLDADDIAVSTSELPRREDGAVVDDPAGELGARGHAELSEDLAQVVLDGARADEQLSSDIAVRLAPTDQGGDMRLLRGELIRETSVAVTVPGSSGGALLSRLGPRVPPSESEPRPEPARTTVEQRTGRPSAPSAGR